MNDCGPSSRGTDQNPPMRTAIVIVLLVATQVAHADKPSDRARTLLDTQLEALRGRDDATLWTTFADDAVILGFATDKPAKSLAISTVIFDQIINGPGDVTKSKIASLVAGGDAKTLWWTAEVVMSGTFREAGTTTPTWTEKYRVSELAISDGKTWKVVAAAFDHGRKNLPEVTPDDTPETLAGANEAGPLAALLASPASVASSIATTPGTFVIGTAPGERGLGKAAKKMIAGWSKLSLAVVGTPREVRTATYGFAQAFIEWKKGKTTYRMLAVLFAVPRTDGSWQPVGLHYQ